jgi:polysaccharide export outer membrane protein
MESTFTGAFPHLVGRGFAIGLAAGIIAAFVASAPARAEYLLNPGDVISIATIGSDDLKQSAMIDAEGELTLPLVGKVKAAGLTIEDLRTRVVSILATKVLRRLTSDGREYPVVLSASQLSLTITQYAPVYVTGDVAKPGEQAYRPGLTVRQAVALAGGYDVMRFRMQNPFLEAADLQAEYNGLWAEYVQRQAELLRIKAELAGETRIDAQSVAKLGVPATSASHVLDLQNEVLASRVEDRKKELASLVDGIAQESKRVTTLTELEQKESEGSVADQSEYDRVKVLFDKGAVPITRVSEMRRLILISSTRELQTLVQRYGVEREQQELSRKLQRSRDQIQIGLFEDLAKAELDGKKLHARLQAAQEKIVYTSMVKSQLVRGGDSKPDLTIHRAGKAQESPGPVDQDTLLLPGDVLEVMLHVAPVPPPSE